MQKYGVGLRHTHFPYLESEHSKSQEGVEWFEALLENYMGTYGRPYKMLEKIRADYPIAFHGVSLSIASSEELNFDYMKKAKELYDNFDPFVTSDHMCWTGHAHSNLHNLLPFAYTKENLEFIADKVMRVQDFYAREMTFENLSAYFTLNKSTMSEAQFLNELANKSGCKILLDFNNVYVNAVNQKFDAAEFFETIETKNVSQIHLAGYSDLGTHLFDTHSHPVHAEVWQLFKKYCHKFDVPILLEWDEDIPEFPVLEREVLKAKEIFEGALL
ncbi:DUF692 domain-containing protein [Halobacteriovorax sp. RT-2-6]|uniref:DUF692 domain-containing protein n=1 Tax=unclassified Halobacteriovorax TaxID=2639665 RepID=UPI00399B0B10